MPWVEIQFTLIPIASDVFLVLLTITVTLMHGFFLKTCLDCHSKCHSNYSSLRFPGLIHFMIHSRIIRHNILSFMRCKDGRFGSHPRFRYVAAWRLIRSGSSSRWLANKNNNGRGLTADDQRQLLNLDSDEYKCIGEQ